MKNIYKTINLHYSRIIGICKSQRKILITQNIKHVRIKLATTEIMEFSLIFKFEQCPTFVTSMGKLSFIAEYGISEMKIMFYHLGKIII